MSIHPNRGVTWETAAVPVTKGVDVLTRARLVDPAKLLVAENSSFTVSGGIKRNGHTPRTVLGSALTPADTTISEHSAGGTWTESYQEKVLPSNWLYGFGMFDPSLTYMAPTASAALDLTKVSPQPSAGICFGTALRDNEELFWDGFRLFSTPLAQDDGAPFGEPQKAAGVGHSLVCPVARTTPIAKSGTTQTQASLADNGYTKVVVWLEGTVSYASVYDSKTGAPLRLRVNLATETGRTITAQLIKAVPVGGYVHILVSDSSAQKLYRITHASHNIRLAFSSEDLGSCNGHFDVRVAASNRLAVVRQDTSSNALLTYLDITGAHTNTPAPAGTTLVNSTHVASLGIDVHPTSGHVGIIWMDNNTGGIKAQIFTAGGVDISGVLSVAAGSAFVVPRVTIAAIYLLKQVDQPSFVCFWENDALLTSLGSRAVSPSGVEGTATVRTNTTLLSQAFRVGNYPFVLATHNSTLQTTHFIMDHGLLPVGRLEYGTAYYPAKVVGVADAWTAPVNHLSSTTAKDQLVFHTTIPYNLRLQGTTLPGLVPGATVDAAVFAETSIKECRLDFLPRLRWAQAGKSTFFAGAQLWEYDGLRCVEAGFHLGPESVSMADDVGGSMAAGEKYRYYVQLAYRNAQGEEIRGPGFLSAEWTVGAAKTAVNVTLPYLLTRRPDAYFLVYRNEDSGNLWYLVSSRDPSSANCPKNDPATASVVFSDITAKSGHITHELAPANPQGYLETYTAPANELVAYGKGRLWVAGGECPPGQVFPSRLHYPTQSTAFHPALGIQVYNGPDHPTAIGFVEDVGVIFRRDSAYIQDGFGPDNLSNGGWPAPRLAMSEIGALSQESLAVLPTGLAFQSPAGIRLLGPGGGLSTIGLDVDPLGAVAHVSAAVVVPDDQQVRFYSPDGDALVFDYLAGSWAVWTGLQCWGAVKSPGQTRPTLARPDGVVWTETPGVYNDAGTTYRQRIRTAWLHGGTLGGFERIRRVGLLGSRPGDDFTLTMRLFYDERDFPEEERTWDTSTNLGTSGWGDNKWGAASAAPGATPAGVWGDSGTTGALRDNVLRARFRTARQKCSTISVEFDDGAVDGPGFELTAVLLETGSRGGLDRIPWRTSSQASVVGSTGGKAGGSGGVGV